MKTIALVIAMLISINLFSKSSNESKFTNKIIDKITDKLISINLFSKSSNESKYTNKEIDKITDNIVCWDECDTIYIFDIKKFIDDIDYSNKYKRINYLDIAKTKLRDINHSIKVNKKTKLLTELTIQVMQDFSVNDLQYDDLFIICHSIMDNDYDTFNYLLDEPLKKNVLELAFRTSIDILHREKYYDILVDKIDLNDFDYMNYAILKYNDYAINDLINRGQLTSTNQYATSITNNNIEIFEKLLSYNDINNISNFHNGSTDIINNERDNDTVIVNNDNILDLMDNMIPSHLLLADSMSLLMHSLYMKRYNIAKIIMEHNPDTSIKNSYGMYAKDINPIMYDYIINNKDYKTIDTTISLFHLACIVGDLETVEIEYDKKIVDKYDRYGMTGLMYACVNSNVDVVEYLINKADLSLLNKFNKELFETSNIKEFVNYENIENDTKILKMSERNRKISDIIMVNADMFIFTDFYVDKSIDFNIKLINPNIYIRLCLLNK